ncbi:MAG: hypothetical protein WCQ00_04045 [bacterium]
MKLDRETAKILIQGLLTQEEWLRVIQSRIDMIKPYMYELTFNPLGELALLYDDFGRHTLKDLVKGAEYLPFLDNRGILPLGDDNVSDNTFHFNDDPAMEGRPDGVTQKLWMLDRSCNWYAVQVRSNITYENHGQHTNLRRCTPMEVLCAPTALDDSFWEFTNRTPNQIWQRLGDAIKEHVKKRRELLNVFIDLERTVNFEENLLNLDR